MENQILNTPEYRKHPLYNMLCDCIVVETGGSTSQCLAKAIDVGGWSHDFLGWEGQRSLEKLSWKPEVFDKLKMIYSKEAA